MVSSFLDSVWRQWGLVPRLMLAVGFAIFGGGGLQTVLLVAEGATESSVRLGVELQESLAVVSPLVADNAITGDYAAIEQLLKNQVRKGSLDLLSWRDSAGRSLSAQDVEVTAEAPGWFIKMTAIDSPFSTIEVTSGGVNYGFLEGKTSSILPSNRLWKQFVKQVQIMTAILFMMLIFIWLIFRGNLGTLRMLAEGADRFSQGDRSVRIQSDGAPEVQKAVEAFNNMADNTERLLTSLGESESKNQLLATIVEQSSEAIWTTDLDGSITTWNASAAAMFGYPLASVLGKNLRLTEASKENELDRSRRLAKGERLSYDEKAKTSSGREIDIRVAAAPMFGRDSKPAGSIYVARDVTQEKKDAEALQLAHTAAELANQSKSTFLARMSHEIRTPMNGVLGMTELLLETNMTDLQRKYAETALSSGKILLGIINDVLDFSKIEAGKLELELAQMDVRSVIEDTIALLAGRAQLKGLDLGYVIEPNVHTHVIGDPLRLSQILTNLVGNAIKFTESGSVVIGLTMLSSSQTHVRLGFEVRDTGVGIELDAQKRVFDEFSQADGSTTRKHGGSGLGLAISRQLVEMMGGKLTLESVVGVGSSFSFSTEFPKSFGQEMAIQLLQPDWGSLSFLFVEPNPVYRDYLKSQVQAWGVKLVDCVSLDDARARLGRTQDKVDVLILGVGTGEDGVAFCREVRGMARVDDLRVIFLAPMGQHESLREAEKAGANACLSMPVRQSDLYDCLSETFSETTWVERRAARDATLVDLSESQAIEPAERKRILLVEDNLVNRTVAVGMLTSLKRFDVEVAADGVQCLEAFKHSNFDLILMDMQMPVMDGLTATREIRAIEKSRNQQRIPIVALTANALAQDRQLCIDAGMDDHLSKPFNRAQLDAMMTHWLPVVQGGSEPDDDGFASIRAGVLVDSSVVDSMKEWQDPTGPGFNRLIDIFVDDSRKLTDQLSHAVRHGDFDAAKVHAHTLKSSSGNLGAVRLASVCAALEVELVKNQSPGVSKLSDLLVATQTATSETLLAMKTT
jgi:PAS domain S-box-containing protein